MIGNARSEADRYTPDATREKAGDKRTVEGHGKASNKWMEEVGGKRRLGLEIGTVTQPETPRKAMKTNGFATPGSKRKWEGNALPTPATTREEGFTSASLLKGGIWDGNKRFPSPNTATTPTPARFRDAADASQGSTSTDKPLNSYDITEEVMEILEGQGVGEEAKKGLQEVLGRQALRISGIVKGRDITRVALKAKDTKIAELQQKISALETEREMDRTIIRQLKSGKDT